MIPHHSPTRDLVVVVSGTPWDGARFGMRHVAERLTRYADVLFVDPPQSPVSARRAAGRFLIRREPVLTRRDEHLYRLRPRALPGWTRPGIHLTTQWLLRRHLGAAVRRLGRRVPAVVTSSPHHFVFGVCGEAVRVYYAFDDFAAGASLQGVPPSRLARSEARAAREADVVVAASPVLRDAWSAAGARTILLPNGVDAGFLATAEGSAEPADIRVPPPIAGFVGHISDRIDLSLLHSVAERGISLLLVGPRQATFRSDAEFDRLLSAPNVQWAGPKPYEELPRYLGAMSVGLVPYTGSPFNRASFPLKALEYLAAGLAVVSTDLPSVRWLDTELIDIAPGRTEFSSAVQRHLGDADGETRAARRSFGAAHDWDRRVDRLAKVLAVSG